MLKKPTPVEILDTIAGMFPQARCELEHTNNYEMTVAVILSAQTTDASVNKVTPALFAKYPTVYALAESNLKDVEDCIHTLGLYRNKARSIQMMAKTVVEKYHGEIPSTMKELCTLEGVGRKCANVILSECFGVPSIAVDTHVNRVSKRLTLAKPDDSLLQVETKLKRKLPKERWTKAHHQMIFFGRYYCTSRNPKCEQCPFRDFCAYVKHKTK